MLKLQLTPCFRIRVPQLCLVESSSRTMFLIVMTDRLATDIQEDFLTCGLCHKPYQHPKALPCLHSFCRSCLHSHFKQNAIRAADDGVLCIFCPTCKQVVESPAGGVDSFHDNPLLTALLDMLYSRSLQTCDVCKEVECRRRNATFCCIRCEDFLCEDCASNHKRTRVTRDHLLINVCMVRDVCLAKHDSKINVRMISKISQWGPSLYNPVSITCNMADDIIVSNGNDTISVFSSNGECKKTLSQRLFYGEEKNFLPNRGVSMTSEGFVAVAMRKDIAGSNGYLGVVQTFAGREVSEYCVKTRHVKDCIPHGIVVTPDNYTIITDVGRHCFYIFNPDRELVKTVGKRGSRRSQFKSPYFVAINNKKEILISDYDNHCIKVFDSKGKFRHKFGVMGREMGEFMHPMGICCDKDNNVFVCDRDNHRVQMFSSDGTFLTIICKNTCRDGNDTRPVDVSMTTAGALLVLVRGVEGIEVAEIHLLQVGVSRFSEQEKSKRAKEVHSQLNELRQSMEGLKLGRGKPSLNHLPTPAQRAGALPPLEPIRSQRQTPTAPTPDLLMGGRARGYAVGGYGAGMEDLGHGGGSSRGKGPEPSSVCTIL